MNTLDVYNLLDGKSLCNIFASLIVNKINELTPNSVTEISVTNIRSFFIVKGRTTSETLINPSEILQEFLKTYSDKKSESVRVIDVILYNTTFDPHYLSIDSEFNKRSDASLIEEQKYVNSFISDGIYFNYKINYDLDTVFFDCEDGYQDMVTKKLSERFDTFNIIKSDFTQENYQSDRFYGISNTPEKLYYLLLKNISHHLFNLGISKKLNLSLQSNMGYDDIDSLTCFFKVLNDDHIVKTDWLESLILDVFPFTVKDLNGYFNIKSYNPIDELLGVDKTHTWMNLSSVKDLMLI